MLRKYVTAPKYNMLASTGSTSSVRLYQLCVTRDGLFRVLVHESPLSNERKIPFRVLPPVLVIAAKIVGEIDGASGGPMARSIRSIPVMGTPFANCTQVPGSPPALERNNPRPASAVKIMSGF